MADTKISSLTDGTTPQDSDLFVAARSSSNVKLSWSELKTAVPSDLVQIFDSTLGADAASIDTGANSIPGTYRHLLIFVNVRTTEAVVESLAQIRFNGDSGTNYDEQDVRVINTTVSGALTIGGTEQNLRALGASAPANRFTQHTLQIMDYAQTAAFKNITGTYVSISGTAATCRTGNKSAVWKSTAAITQVLLQATTGNNLLAGTSLTIYGAS